jgi:hypothetical protein
MSPTDVRDRLTATLRLLVILAVITVPLTWSIVLVASLPYNRLAVARDDRMEPTVPQGALMIMPVDRDGHAVGDVIAWWPKGDGKFAGPFGIFEVYDEAIPGRVAPRRGSVTITFDNRPDEAPLVVPHPGRVRDPVTAYIPFVGYLLWPGPIGFALITAAAFVALYITRDRRDQWAYPAPIGQADAVPPRWRAARRH